MKAYFLWGGLALCLFALWAMLRHDWLRLTRPSVRGAGTVTGHAAGWSDGSRTYAARIAFVADGEPREFIDQMQRPAPRPPVGTVVTLAWPEGRPDLARPPRPLLWALVYGLIVALAGVLAARLLGWIGGV